MCGAIQGGLSLDGVNVAKEAIIQGQVLRVDASGHRVPVENAVPIEWASTTAYPRGTK